MKRFYQQVYFPELPDEYEANIVEIEVPNTIEDESVFKAINEAQEGFAEDDDMDRWSQAEAIYTVAMEAVGGSWKWLYVSGVLEVG